MATIGRAVLAIVIGLGLFGVGLAGASLFNPDDGSLAHSAAAWRVFGIAAYAGLGLAWLGVLACVAASLALALRRAMSIRRGGRL